jgi:hypothetical protein
VNLVLIVRPFPVSLRAIKSGMLAEAATRSVIQALRRRYETADRAGGNGSLETSMPSTSLAGSMVRRGSATLLSATREEKGKGAQLDLRSFFGPH